MRQAARPNNLLIINNADHWLKPKTDVGQRVGDSLEFFDRKYSLQFFLTKRIHSHFKLKEFIPTEWGLNYLHNVGNSDMRAFLLSSIAFRRGTKSDFREFWSIRA